MPLISNKLTDVSMLQFFTSTEFIVHYLVEQIQ